MQAAPDVVLPHVRDCSMCLDCAVDEPQDLAEVPVDDIKPEIFMPHDVKDKQQKPFCPRCRGCTTSLALLVTSDRRMFNRTFLDETGASPSWLFVSATNRTHNGKAIVKVPCIPVGKSSLARYARCMANHFANFARVYYAVEKLAEECGLQDVVPKVWIQHVSAVIPQIGYHIRWHALWMEQADGVSLENLVRLGTPMMHPNDLLAILHNVVNKTQIVRAAIFDLLTMQSDRHAQNVFVAGDGSVKLIDNEAAFYHNRQHSQDSILLPTTKKYAINVMENAWVNKFHDWPKDKVPQCWANVALLFDYRCYVKDGKIGKNWPPEVQRCLAKVSSTEVQRIQHDYGLPERHMAEALLNRTKDMLENGFEYALTLGYPRNPNPWRYRFTPPCCKIKHTDTYRCAHEWKPSTEIPFGDPIMGGPWRHQKEDPGSYEGGSSF